jgi:hypothetical protein
LPWWQRKLLPFMAVTFIVSVAASVFASIILPAQPVRYSAPQVEWHREAHEKRREFSVSLFGTSVFDTTFVERSEDATTGPNK